VLCSEDQILIKTCGNLKDFLSKNSSTNILTKMEKTNIGRLSAKVAHNAVRSNALLEAVSHSHSELTLPQLNAMHS